MGVNDQWISLTSERSPTPPPPPPPYPAPVSGPPPPYINASRLASSNLENHPLIVASLVSRILSLYSYVICIIGIIQDVLERMGHCLTKRHFLWDT